VRRVLGPSADQAAIFGAVSDVVQSALDGYHVCLFSYGQTGSGKTHTMNGVPHDEAQRGIIPRAIAKILENAERLKLAGWEFELQCSFIEIYNEALRDLLGQEGPGRAGRQLEGSCIKHNPNGHTEVRAHDSMSPCHGRGLSQSDATIGVGVRMRSTHRQGLIGKRVPQVVGATKVAVDSQAVALELITRAAKARSTDATNMNATSSRSHSVFTLHITGRHEESGVQLLGSLNLVDLAGSERLARSGAEGQRQKETCAINKSLSSLGDIFQARLAWLCTLRTWAPDNVLYLADPRCHHTELQQVYAAASMYVLLGFVQHRLRFSR
jgi:kinesin family member C1